MTIHNFDPYQNTQNTTTTSTTTTTTTISQENDPLSVFETTTSNLPSGTANGNDNGDAGDGEFQELSIHDDDDDDDEPIEIIDESPSAARHEGGGEDDLLGLGGFDGHPRGGGNDASSGDGDGVGLAKSSGMWAYALNHDGGTSRQQVNGGDGDSGAGRSQRGLFSRWGSARNEDGDAGGSGAATSSRTVGGGGIFGRPFAGNGDDAAPTAAGEGGLTGDDDLRESGRSKNDGGDGTLDDGDDDDLIDPELEEEHDMDNLLRPGDHIYVWQSYGINPRAYQRHAVVYSVTHRGDSEPSIKANMTTLSDYEQQANDPIAYDTSCIYDEQHRSSLEVTVVSFYHFQRHHAHGAARAATAASGSTRGKRSGCKRELLIDFLGPDAITKKKPIHKVRYGRQVKKGLLSQKASVGTALKKDAVGLILARVTYLLEHPDHLPEHNALSANGECAAMWCVTGRWCTLQGASILQITSVGQAGGALLAGGILSNLTVLVPMPGLWGAAGWWWYVPTTVAYPFLVPMLVAFGMCSLVPLEILRRNRKKWRGITDGLNHEFWINADPEVKDKYFGMMATAEREAEMRSFFGVRENDTSAEDSRYMPLGGTPGGIDDDDDEDEDEVLAMQKLEKSCATMDVDLSGKPPSRSQSSSGGWGSFMGSFRRKEPNAGSQSLRELQRQGDSEIYEGEKEGIIS
ncbi:hypothetical protein ACHAXS_012232 [Conticribra weissflogii]